VQNLQPSRVSELPVVAKLEDKLASPMPDVCRVATHDKGHAPLPQTMKEVQEELERERNISSNYATEKTCYKGYDPLPQRVDGREGNAPTNYAAEKICDQGHAPLPHTVNDGKHVGRERNTQSNYAAENGVKEDLPRTMQEVKTAVGHAPDLLPDVKSVEEAPLFRTSDTCPSGHILLCFMACRGDRDYGCDTCRREIPQGQHLWGCRTCNFDKCGYCVRKASPSEPAVSNCGMSVIENTKMPQRSPPTSSRGTKTPEGYGVYAPVLHPLAVSMQPVLTVPTQSEDVTVVFDGPP